MSLFRVNDVRLLIHIMSYYFKIFQTTNGGVIVGARDRQNQKTNPICHFCTAALICYCNTQLFWVLKFQEPNKIIEQQYKAEKEKLQKLRLLLVSYSVFLLYKIDDVCLVL